jgi:hypothetical protein
MRVERLSARRAVLAGIGDIWGHMAQGDEEAQGEVGHFPFWLLAACRTIWSVERRASGERLLFVFVFFFNRHKTQGTRHKTQAARTSRISFWIWSLALALAPWHSSIFEHRA